MSFWSTGDAWGNFVIEDDSLLIEVKQGGQELKRFGLSAVSRLLLINENQFEDNILEASKGNEVIFIDGFILNENDQLVFKIVK
jgi:hypothetical protein